MKRSLKYSRQNGTKTEMSKRLVYLDNAATTFPKPPEVAVEVTRAINEYGGNPGRGAHILSRRADAKINEVRTLADKLFSVGDPSRVIFTHGATDALNVSIFSACRNGGHVLISDIEHAAVYRPLCALEEMGKISLEIYPTYGNAQNICEGIKNRLRSDTTLVVACHRSNIAPKELPIYDISRICRERKIKFIADVSQSAGSCEINAQKLGAWAICAPGHKGLYGVQGCGLLIVGRDASPEDFLPLSYGGSYESRSEREMPLTFPHRLEGGTLPTPAIAGLGEGLKFVINTGVSTIEKYENDLMHKAHNELSKLSDVRLETPRDALGSILLFNTKNIPPSEAARLLGGLGICVRGGFHCSPLAHRHMGTFPYGGGVRVSFGAFSEERDIDALCRAVYRIAKR